MLTNQTSQLDLTVCSEKWKSIGKYYFFTWLMLALKMHSYFGKNIEAGLEIVTDKVANVTSIFSLATKTSSLVATLATRFLYDIDLN